MPNSIVFKPKAVGELKEKLEKYSYKRVQRDSFVKKYSRQNINKLMVKSIIELL